MNVTIDSQITNINTSSFFYGCLGVVTEIKSVRNRTFFTITYISGANVYKNIRCSSEYIVSV